MTEPLAFAPRCRPFFSSKPSSDFFAAGKCVAAVFPIAFIVGMDKRERNRISRAAWRAAHREEHRASVKAWRLANPDLAREKDRRAQDRRKAKRAAERAATASAREAAKIATAEARRQKARERYSANPAPHLERSRKWRDANPGKSAALQRAWKDRNREKVRAAKRARKSAKRIAIVRELTRLQRGRCAYCRAKLAEGFHVDHVMPLKLGGADKRPNLQLACPSCNLAKNAKHPVEFAQSLGRLI